MDNESDDVRRLFFLQKTETTIGERLRKLRIDATTTGRGKITLNVNRTVR